MKKLLKFFSTKDLLIDMTRQDLLMRVKEGLYYVIPYEQEPETFMPDWHLLAACLVKDKDIDHYIGYYSALKIHQLITQPSLKEQIVVNQQVRHSAVDIKNSLSKQLIFKGGSVFRKYNSWD